MGFLDKIKDKFSSSENKISQEQLNGYLKSTKTNLRGASDNINKFLDAMRDFQPARRHEALYYEQVRDKLVSMKAGVHRSFSFLDERMNNNINTLNTVKNPDQLRTMISDWIKNIQANDEKVYDILKILRDEMWSQDKINKHFPIPASKDMVLSYLINTVNYLRSARDSLDNYIAFNGIGN